MKKRIIDTNLIIRFLVNDDPAKANSVKRLLQNKEHKNILSELVVAEIIWVLSSYYESPKEYVVEKIRGLIHLDSVECNTPLINNTLSIWEESNISFIDAYLSAMARNEGCPIYSYDLKFDKIKDVQRKEPEIR